jgi:hypothetical protein
MQLSALASTPMPPAQFLRPRWPSTWSTPQAFLWETQVDLVQGDRLTVPVLVSSHHDADHCFEIW